MCEVIVTYNPELVTVVEEWTWSSAKSLLLLCRRSSIQLSLNLVGSGRPSIVPTANDGFTHKRHRPRPRAPRNAL